MTAPFAIRPRGRRRHKPGQMNRLEAKYADVLFIRKQAGEILDYWFEGLKLKLADKTFFTPDFLVMLADGLLECHEVKGGKKKPNGEPGFWAEEDAKIKVKVAAGLFPFQFRIMFHFKGEWYAEEV